MGSGSCGEACLNTNRNFIGIEMNEDWFSFAKNRLENNGGNVDYGRINETTNNKN